MGRNNPPTPQGSTGVWDVLTPPVILPLGLLQLPILTPPPRGRLPFGGGCVDGFSNHPRARVNTKGGQKSTKVPKNSIVPPLVPQNYSKMEAKIAQKVIQKYSISKIMKTILLLLFTTLELCPPPPKILFVLVFFVVVFLRSQ